MIHAACKYRNGFPCKTWLWIPDRISSRCRPVASLATSWPWNTVNVLGKNDQMCQMCNFRPKYRKLAGNWDRVHAWQLKWNLRAFLMHSDQARSWLDVPHLFQLELRLASFFHHSTKSSQDPCWDCTEGFQHLVMIDLVRIHLHLSTSNPLTKLLDCKVEPCKAAMVHCRALTPRRSQSLWSAQHQPLSKWISGWSWHGQKQINVQGLGAKVRWWHNSYQL